MFCLFSSSCHLLLDFFPEHFDCWRGWPSPHSNWPPRSIPATNKAYSFIFFILFSSLWTVSPQQPVSGTFRPKCFFVHWTLLWKTDPRTALLYSVMSSPLPPLCLGSSHMVIVRLVLQPPTLWNRLPANIRNASSLENFKSLLKTHLFKVAFTDR